MFDSIKIAEDTEFFSLIKKNWQPSEYKKDFVLFYENQVPNVSVLLLSGGASLQSKKRKEEIPANSLVGNRSLLNESPVDYTLTIKEGSLAYILDKPSIIGKIGLDQWNRFLEKEIVT